MSAKYSNAELEVFIERLHLTGPEEVQAIIEKLALTAPELRDEPRAYPRAMLRMGFSAGVQYMHDTTLKALEEGAA